MKLIVGLGNPGEKYENTRHNIGFLALDSLLKELERVEKTQWEHDKKGKVDTKEVWIHAEKVLLARPHIFMNNSGFVVSYLLNYYKLQPENIIVVYDDLDLPFGKIRVRFGGAAGGHKGVESIITNISSDKFLRIRLGIGRPQKKSKVALRSAQGDAERSRSIKSQMSKVNIEEYVLSSFAPNEKSKVRHMIKEATKNILLILEHGIEKYMSKYNGELKTKD